MEYKMVKTESAITYFVNGKIYSFENQPEIISFIERNGFEPILENNIETLILMKDEPCFVKEIEGRKFILPADLSKFKIAEKCIINNPNYYMSLSIEDVFTTFSKNNVSSDGRIIVKCFCEAEVFEQKGIVNLDIWEEQAKKKGDMFMLFVKSPIEKTVGNRINLSDEDIEIIESVWLPKPNAREDINENDF